MNMMNRSFQRPAGPPASTATSARGPDRPTDQVVTPPQSALRAPVSGPGPTRPGQHPAPGRGVNPKANVHRGDDMLAVVRQLSDLLSKENASLKRHKVGDVKVLGERKEQLARLYQQHMNALHRDPDAVKTWDAGKRNALAHAAIRMSELMKENASLLKANITTINKFLGSVVEAVKEKQEKQSASYSRQGSLNGYAAVKRNLAVSFNQTM
jgi:translation initiation factor 2 beta subunit (eIF-2beta)/eIF-5